MIRRNYHLTLKYNSMSTLIIFIFIIIDVLRFFAIIPVNFASAINLILGFLSIILVAKKRKFNSLLPMITFFFIYTCFGFIGVLYNRNIDLVELLWPLAYGGLALLVIYSKMNYLAIKKLYYFISTVFIIVFSMDSINLLVTTSSSRNAIGVIMIMILSFYLISARDNYKKTTIFPVFLGLVVSLLAIGRSSILTFLILIVGFILFESDRIGTKRRKTYKIVSILIILSVFVAISMNTFFLSAISNFEYRGLESIRTYIWHDYFLKTGSSLGNIIFGTPIEGTMWLDAYRGNLHNSILMLHSKYGIVTVFVLLVLIAKSIIHYFKNKDMIFLFLAISIIFRMQFDHTNFNAQLDVILYYLIFYPIYVKKKSFKRIE